MGDVASLLDKVSLNVVIIVVAAVISIWYACAKIKDYVDTKKQALLASERQRVEEESNLRKRLETQQEAMKELRENQLLLTKGLDKISSQIDLLISSDMADIKSYITARYNEFTKLGYIDIHSLQACEKRFEYYKLQGGNSFVEQLMNQLEALPHTPPQK